MEFDNGLERDVQKQLVICTALHVVLGGSLAVTETAWLGTIEENSNSPGVLIRVENLQITEFYLVGDVVVASWSFHTLPAGTTAGRASVFSGGLLIERSSQGRYFHERIPKFLRIGPLDLVDLLSICKNDEGWQVCNFVFLRELWLVVAVNLDQRDEIRLRYVFGESFVDRSDLVGRVRPIGVNLKESFVSFYHHHL